MLNDLCICGDLGTMNISIYDLLNLNCEIVRPYIPVCCNVPVCCNLLNLMFLCT
jgi:hypothetical protein